MDQGSPEWFRIRLGKITGSEMKRVMGSERAWASYARQLREEMELLKRLEAGELIELGADFDSAATAWGRQWEPRAVAEYEFREDVDTRSVGFAFNVDLPFVGCSVDREVFRDPDIIEGILEVKCPYSESVHLHTVASGHMPSDHIPQVMAEIWIYGIEWASFVSYDPRRDLSRQYFHRLVERDDEYIARMERRCLEFWEFVQSGADEPGRIKSDHTGSNTIPQLF